MDMYRGFKLERNAAGYIIATPGTPSLRAQCNYRIPFRDYADAYRGIDILWNDTKEIRGATHEQD